MNESWTKMTRARLFAFLVASASLATGIAMAEPACPPENGIAVQVLGSGGPVADDARASTAYLVWADGVSRVLVDAGGGSFLRFGEAGASFTDLDFIGISHFHTDHSADLAALLKSGYFSDRARPLALSGPGPGGPFPGLNGYLEALLDPETGAYGYLSGYLDGTDGLVKLETREIPFTEDSAKAVTVLATEQFGVQAMSIPHGIVPALAYRLQIGGMRLVFGGDQNGSDPAFVDFAREADLLVMHMAIPPGAGDVAKKLHPTPAGIGAIAKEAGVKSLLLSHFMARSLHQLDRNVEIVRQAYDGRVVVAEDLACVLP
ncbi:MAG: MBL fold metallo-hydrolase [Xanthomonadales bacterium]|jgi:ribonuclease BN (tRNA processing enzyme)|nr:MBL fold metallo-hydrolase [Xanthomonadales bacterium]